jgi:RHS repeat-associated protein
VRKNGAAVESYTYDNGGVGNGNRTSATVNGVGAAGAYDDQDRLTAYGGATYAYTANGELRTKTAGGQTTTYAYDELGNLTAVDLPDGRAVTYLIDGRNRRVGKRVDGALVQGFLYDGQLRIAAELDGANTVVSRFIYGARLNVPEYMVRGGVAYRIVADHLGSPRLVVNAATGEVAQRTDYDAFGNVTFEQLMPGFQPVPFGFAGGLYDRDTKLVRFGARDYDAETGRWTAKDPDGFAAGDTNLFGYVLGDPVNFNDYDGRKWQIAVGISGTVGLGKYWPGGAGTFIGGGMSLAIDSTGTAALQFQFNQLKGGGTYVGVGVQGGLTRTQDDQGASLNQAQCSSGSGISLSIAEQEYGEFNAGWGLSFGGSASVSQGQSSFGIAHPKWGFGYGFMAGEGRSTTTSISFPARYLFWTAGPMLDQRAQCGCQ